MNRDDTKIQRLRRFDWRVAILRKIAPTCLDRFAEHVDVSGVISRAESARAAGLPGADAVAYGSTIVARDGRRRSASG